MLTMCDYWFAVTDHRHTAGDAAMLGGELMMYCTMMEGYI